MFEKRHQPLAHKSIFYLRILRSMAIGLIAILFTNFIGMLGYHFFEKMPWVDAFANASMILSGMGPLTPLATFSGKVFAGFYALFSGLLFIFIIGIIFAPIIHRFLHNFHIEDK